MAVAGASRYLNASILSNTRGFAGSQANLISSLGTVSLLDVGRSVAADNGIGLSGRARLANKQFLESSASTFNSIFSLSVGTTSTVEGMQKQILALRSSLSPSQVARSLIEDDGSIQGSLSRGSSVDVEA